MFKIQQEIIAIKPHPNGEFKTGEIFYVINISPATCKCHDFLIDVGVRHVCNDFKFICFGCNNKFQHFDNIRWFSNHYFVALELGYADFILSEIEKQEEELIEI